MLNGIAARTYKPNVQVRHTLGAPREAQLSQRCVHVRAAIAASQSRLHTVSYLGARPMHVHYILRTSGNKSGLPRARCTHVH